MNVENGQQPIGKGNSSRISKTKAMKKLADRKALSPAEAKKAMQGIAKFYKQGGSHSAAKRAAITKMLGPSVEGNNPQILQKANRGAAATIQTLCGPEKLQEVIKERNSEIFSIPNAQHYGDIMGSVLLRAESDKGRAPSNSLTQFQQIANKCYKKLPDSPSKEEFLKCIQQLKKATIQELEKLSPGQGKKNFNKLYTKVLSHNTWETFSGNIELVSKYGERSSVTSSLKPA
ncbi:MAG: hypothetical protein LBS71_01820, partial [Puniceicoccales bacterium]|nr:hypothetical protein [Puniceicoccales bacterium]